MRASLVLLFGLLPLACSGPGVADLATSEIVMTVSALASAPEQVALGESAGGLGVTRVFLNTSALGLVACDSGVADLTLGRRGYDLLAEPPARELVGTAVTELCSVRIDIDAVKPTPEGVPAGAALYAEGTDADGAEVSFSTSSSTSVLLQAVDDVPFGDQPLLLGLDVSVWLGQLSPDDAMSDPEGAQAELDSRTASALAIYADLNDNRALDDDETTPLAVAR
jgi:hypothetical protein